MKPHRRIICLATAMTCLLVANNVRGELVGGDDFLYHQPTKALGPGGGFTLQDYGGGQNGTNAEWAARWVSSGNGIITGEDFEEEADQFLGITAAGLAPVYANYLERGVGLNGLASDQTLYFAVRSRVGIDDVTALPRFWLNAPVGDPLSDDGQIGIGIDEFGGVVAEIGFDFEANEDEPLNDGEFHLLVGKFEINASGSDERLTVWADPTAVEEGLSASVEADVVESLANLRSQIRLGRLGEGSAIYWDDVAVGTTWESVTELNVPRVTLRVDPTNGNTSLVNESGSDFDLSYYEIESASAGLNVAGWNSLDDQAVSGDAWLENNPSNSAITESNFSGSTTLANGNAWPLGSVYTPGADRDLVARVGTSRGLLNITNIDYAEISLRGDFNGNGLIDADDMDLLTTEVRAGTNNVTFDLNSDNLVNDDDRAVWVEAPDIGNSYFGDSNLDGQFNSTDFVVVFTAGEYEDGVVDNSVWATGDWNGDGDFDSSDFVTAFQSGGYEAGERVAVQAVPEPTGIALLVTALAMLAMHRRK